MTTTVLVHAYPHSRAGAKAADYRKLLMALELQDRHQTDNSVIVFSFGTRDGQNASKLLTYMDLFELFQVSTESHFENGRR